LCDLEKWESRLDLVLEVNGASISQLLSSHMNARDVDIGPEYAQLNFTDEDNEWIESFIDAHLGKRKVHKWQLCANNARWAGREDVSASKIKYQYALVKQIKANAA
jgi:hypothetical protein